MQLIIDSIEELISSKRSQLKYLNEEMDRVSRQIVKEQNDIRRLEWELVDVKKIPQTVNG
jgi:predicted  nucleic acid-binding Zn-ribbon protein